MGKSSPGVVWALKKRNPEGFRFFNLESETGFIACQDTEPLNHMWLPTFVIPSFALIVPPLSTFAKTPPWA